MSDQLMQCPRCGDPITNELGDNPICGACALASELHIKALQASIAELKQQTKREPIWCAKCNDGIEPEDGAICGTCANAIDGNMEYQEHLIKRLRKEVIKLRYELLELKKSAIVWHRYPDTKPAWGEAPQQSRLFDISKILSIVVLTKHDKLPVQAGWLYYVEEDTFMSDEGFTLPNDMVLAYAYLPDPPSGHDQPPKEEA